MRLLPVLALSFLASCATGRDAVAVHAPEFFPQFEQAEQLEARLEAEIPALEQAVAAGDEQAKIDLAEAQSLLDATQAELQKIEEAALRRQADPIGKALPYGLGYLAIEAAVAIGSKRKRRLYGSAIKSMSRFDLMAAAGAFLQGLGAKHSAGQPSAPTEPPAPQA